MKGNVYLTYYANADKIENCYKVAISRWLPKSIKKCTKIYDSNQKGVYVHIPQFAPEEDFLSSYKVGDIDIATMLSEFDLHMRELLNYDIAIKRLVNDICLFIDKGNNVAFVCYEKDSDLCHRKIIGEIFKRMGYNIIVK